MLRQIIDVVLAKAVQLLGIDLFFFYFCFLFVPLLLEFAWL